MHDRLLSYEDLSDYLGVAPATLRGWVSKGRIPYVKVGRLTKFRRNDIDRYLEKNAVKVA